MSARDRRLSRGQIVVVCGLALGLVGGSTLAPDATGAFLVRLAWTVFLVLAAWRVLAVIVSHPPRGSRQPPPEPASLPAYTIIAALRHEAAMIPQLVSRLSRIDYPADRLECFLTLEIDDAATIAAALACPRPDWLKVLIVPPGTPTTKPRALNFALSRAVGELITVYDAEDDPDPGQLREAAARFAEGGPKLACLQAPLRIRRAAGSRSRFLDRQFALEYAALFEVLIPALVRLGLPFPLGGTSNHFRADVLRALDGWDAWNVTEDADLGFRLWRGGYRTGVINSPTWETPPGALNHWLPQRTRWLKGFMQTWGVHMRDPLGLGWRGVLALNLTLGQTIMAAAFHAVAAAWVIALVLSAVMVGLPPATPTVGLAVLILGSIAALATSVTGARRAGVDWSVADLLGVPLYWSLLTQAFAHALWRLISQPHAWDKTPHTPEEPAAKTPGDQQTGPPGWTKGRQSA
jgi:cellulose synthase/poly-beta-1,6-N-acetylglucosamine synthase-like glycosyltransferase